MSYRRPCTCPAGEAPMPCAHKYALSECEAEHQRLRAVTEDPATWQLGDAITPENADSIPSCMIMSCMTQAQIVKVQSMMAQMRYRQRINAWRRSLVAAYWTVMLLLSGFIAWLVYLIWF